MPECSLFNRRRRNLLGTLNRQRQPLLRQLDLVLDCQCVLDGLTIPMPGFHRRPALAGYPYLARIGWTKSETLRVFGYKLNLLININRLITDFALAHH